MTYDLIIRGGTIVDGSGLPGYRADVAIAEGMIAAIGDFAGAREHSKENSTCLANNKDESKQSHHGFISSLRYRAMLPLLVVQKPLFWLLWPRGAGTRAAARPPLLCFVISFFMKRN